MFNVRVDYPLAEDERLIVSMSARDDWLELAKELTVYHNGTWSPVLLRVPGEKEAQTRTELVSSGDVMPSVLVLLGTGAARCEAPAGHGRAVVGTAAEG